MAVVVVNNGLNQTGLGRKFVIRIKDNGSAATITWNAIFRAIGVTLPTTTTASKTIYIGCLYNDTDSKWDVIAVKEEA
jgi:TATA-binding protein-associated factor Taf7